MSEGSQVSKATLVSKLQILKCRSLSQWPREGIELSGQLKTIVFDPISREESWTKNVSGRNLSWGFTMLPFKWKQPLWFEDVCVQHYMFAPMKSITHTLRKNASSSFQFFLQPPSFAASSLFASRLSPRPSLWNFHLRSAAPGPVDIVQCSHWFPKRAKCWMLARTIFWGFRC